MLALFPPATTMLTGSAKIKLPPSETPLTVVTAMVTPDHLLLGADSQVTLGETFTTSTVKVHKFDGLPLAWGIAGGEGVGLEFGEWIRSYDFRASLQWPEFRDDAANALADLNNKLRRRARRAGVSNPSGEDAYTAEVLIVGYINSKPEILRLASSGETSFQTGKGWATLGTGSVHADMIRTTLVQAEEKLGVSLDSVPTADRFRFITGLAAHLSPQCSPPVHVLQITPHGVEEI